jgi:hypothetical protein
MKCPHCKRDINVGALLGSVSTPRKAAAARENAKLGGWPNGKKRGKRRRQNAEIADKGSGKEATHET